MTVDLEDKLKEFAKRECPKCHEVVYSPNRGIHLNCVRLVWKNDIEKES